MRHTLLSLSLLAILAPEALCILRKPRKEGSCSSLHSLYDDFEAGGLKATNPNILWSCPGLARAPPPAKTAGACQLTEPYIKKRKCKVNDNFTFPC